MTLSTFVLSAQNRDSNKRDNWERSKTDYRPEQRAELRSKQMALELNLNDSQQTKVKQLFLKMGQSNSKISKKRSEMTSDEKFEYKMQYWINALKRTKD